ncbi:MAG: SelT/SelW/SelH family protein [Chloroflexi bacterium]|nr:SelT/SelW/SelH family protein [Chloroflexota bacterium]
MAQELLSRLAEQTAYLQLVPGEKAQFEVTVNGALVFSKVATKRFPEVKELRELIQKLAPASV